MAENEQEDAKEREIPVLTVLKNNCILKNIFLLDNPPSITASENVDQESETEEILEVGRHPHCNIKLEHPSISRFHLRIHSNPSSRSLYVTDLSSVHGTWISGKKVESEVKMKLNEGDTLRLGASTRLYRLTWVPLSRAYDIDNPFVPRLDTEDAIDDEALLDQDNQILLNRNDQVESLSDNPERLEQLFSDEGFCSSLQKTSPLVPLLPEDSHNSGSKEEVEQNTSPGFYFQDNELCISGAYDIDNPIVPQLDTEHAIDEETEEALLDQDKHILLDRNDQVESLSDNLEGLEQLFSDKGFGSPLQKTSPIASLFPEDSHNSDSKEEVEKNSSPGFYFNDNELSISRAYEIGNPFVPKLDTEDAINEETEEALLDQDKHILLDGNDQVGSLSDNLEGLGQMFSDEGFGSSLQETSSIASLLPEDSPNSASKEEVEKNSSPGFYFQDNEHCISLAYDIDNRFVPKLDTEDAIDEEIEEALLEQDKHILLDRNDQVESLSDNLEGLEQLLSDEGFGSSLQKMSPIASLLPEDSHNSVSKEEVEKSSSPGFYFQDNELCADRQKATEISGMTSGENSGLNIWSRRGKSESVRVGTSLVKANSARINMSSQVKKSLDENHKTGSVLKYPDYEEEILMPDKENATPDSILFRSSSMNSEENLKGGLFINSPISSVNQDQDQDEEPFTPDEENMNRGLFRSVDKISVEKPKAHRYSPLKPAYTSTMHQEEADILCASQVCRNREVFQDLKLTNSASKGRGSSVKQSAWLRGETNSDPFCPLPVNTTTNNKIGSIPSVCEDSMKRSRCIKYPNSEESNNTSKVVQNKWTIVVDTACLLNKKSRNELQLLRGLRGTSLVIPRIVVRELVCMLKHGGLFTRTSEVSAALQYIEESISVAKWWIHIQTSAEEGRLIPPTPPASPHWFGDEMWASSIGPTPFSPCGLHEISTPTAGDHLLDYALYHKRIRKDGMIVLLTDDVTLKIKAMAEGVLCETAYEFRRSLVNPFSARFLYSNCSPIGPTWSCADDAVLKDRYYPSPSKKILPKSGYGCVKGLKLILMHNPSFRQIKSVS